MQCMLQQEDELSVLPLDAARAVDERQPPREQLAELRPLLRAVLRLARPPSAAITCRASSTLSCATASEPSWWMKASQLIMVRFA